MSVPPGLLAALVDDAGLFPPTSLPMDRAVERHRADAEADAAMHTHRFLVPASRVGEVRRLLREGEVFALGLIADRGAENLAAAGAEVAADPRLRLALVEAPLAAFGEEEAPALQALLAELKDVPDHVPLYAEPVGRARPGPLLTELTRRAGARPLGAKLRCGGVRADLFPSTGEVAAFVTACVAAGVPFKATAGLHEAVRHTSATTGFTHHGYLNLLLATVVAASGGDRHAVRDVLETEDAAELVGLAERLTAEEAAAARRALVSYGSCSTAAPVREALRLFGPARRPTS